MGCPPCRAAFVWSALPNAPHSARLSSTRGRELGLLLGDELTAFGALPLFAIADAAQDKALPASINQRGRSQCLFDFPRQSELANKAPHLVELPPYGAADPTWRWILRSAPHRPSVTVLSANTNFEVLLEHLRSMTEVILPDGDDLFFAFWDPAILATLVGQPDDSTLHVAGPVLRPDQRAVLLQGVSNWWYWDREGALHRIDGVTEQSRLSTTQRPLELSQSQVDDLVEASVPDHVLYHVELNQPHLFDDMPQAKRYRFVRDEIKRAHAYGLTSMGDLVNFVCAALIYRERMAADPAIQQLLQQVQRGAITFDQAMEAFP